MPPSKNLDAFRHSDDHRTHIPAAEQQSFVSDDIRADLRVAYERRNRDLDPQLIWRGKDLLQWGDLVVNAPPLYIQEKIQPQALVAELLRATQARRDEAAEAAQLDLFADFNGVPAGAARRGEISRLL